MEQELQYIKVKLDMLCDAIMGDPTNPEKPGLILRIDRLEQSNRLKNKVLCALGIGVATAIGQMILTYV